MSWNELATPDVDAAKDFYAELFGWAYQDLDMNGAGAYTIIRTGDRNNGGIRALTPQEQGTPAFWLVYFGTVSCDEGAELAEKLGGRVMVPTMRVPAGGFTVIADPQGAAFALFEGDYDD